MPMRTRSAVAVASDNASSPLLSVPDDLISDFALVRLPARSLGCAAMACVKLRQCASDAILQIARSIHVRRREGESLGSLLFAIRVLKPLGVEERMVQGREEDARCVRSGWESMGGWGTVGRTPSLYHAEWMHWLGSVWC